MNQGKIVFLAANASYSHTNLAGWYLRNYAETGGWRWQEVEIIKTDSLPTVLQRVLRLKPEILAASFYLFNHQFLISFLKRFKALRPDCLVIAGGPEFLGDNFRFLEQNREIDAVIRGEGERAFADWLACCRQRIKWRKIKGLCAFIDGDYIDNGKAEMIRDLDEIPSPYERNLSNFKKPFLLMETSRGCSNKCGFCTSAGERVRFFSLERVRNDFSLIAAGGVREIRLADRTFNENPERCLALLKIMRDEFDEVKFHLEIDPARISDKMITEFARVPAGKFHPPSVLHLEVGIQTTKSGVTAAINRSGSTERSLANLNKLCRLENLKIHVDLMAGLPGAGLEDLYSDLQKIVRLKPDEIQVELLKVLPGTALDRESKKRGMVAAVEPPYEVLQTPEMSADDIIQAGFLSNLVDWFYNRTELKQSIIAAIEQIPRFFEKFTDYCAKHAGIGHAPALEKRFRLLEQFCRLNEPALIPKLGYEWLKWGLSAQHGICEAEPWKKPLPEEAVLVEGAPCSGSHRIYLTRLERQYLFVYGRYPRRRACSIYSL